MKEIKTTYAHREGIYTEYTNTINLMEIIYSLTVPSGIVLSPDSTRPFWLEFWTQETGLVPSGGGGTTVDVTLTNPSLIPVDAAGLPVAAGTVVILTGITTVSTPARVRLTVTGHNAATGVVAFSETLDSGTVTAYYIPATAGQFVMKYARPDMLGVGGRNIMSANTALMVQGNPFHRDTHIPFRSPSVWPSDWNLEYYLNAPWVVHWADDCTASAALPIRWDIPLLVEYRREYGVGLEQEVNASLLAI